MKTLLVIELTDFSEATLISMANDLSVRIDDLATDQGSLPTEVHLELRKCFDAICFHLHEVYDTTISDTVRCPRYD